MEICLKAGCCEGCIVLVSNTASSLENLSNHLESKALSSPDDTELVKLVDFFLEECFTGVD